MEKSRNILIFFFLMSVAIFSITAGTNWYRESGGRLVPDIVAGISSLLEFHLPVPK